MKNNIYICIKNYEEDVKVKLVLESYGNKAYFTDIFEYPKYYYCNSVGKLYTDIYNVKDVIDTNSIYNATEFINKY